jgi:hypothetical protein
MSWWKIEYDKWHPDMAEMIRRRPWLFRWECLKLALSEWWWKRKP